MVWLNGFAKRKKLDITSSDGTLTNHPMMFTVNRADGTDGVSNFYIGSSGCLSDYRDVWFTDENGMLLDWWVETGYTASVATIWVKKSSIATGAYIYMYYGNPAAVSLSNGLKVFELFDDFTSGVFDTAKWTNVGSQSVSFSGGIMTLGAGDGSGSKYIKSVSTFATNKALRIRSSVSSASLYADIAFYDMTNNLATCIYVNYHIANVFNLENRAGGSTNTYVSLGAGHTGYHVFDLIRNGSTSNIVKVDGTTVGTLTQYVPTGSLNILLMPQSQAILVDFVAIRPCTANEPTLASNAEESAPTPVTLKNTTHSAEWLNGFTKRKALNVTSSAVLTEYQMPITINRSAGTDGTGVVYVGTTGCESDYRDIRFTDAFGNALPYWIESSSSSTAYVWVKVNAIATSGTVVYLYYGNAGAVSQSNGDKVFEFFDDFLGSSLSARWTTYGSPTVSVSNSIASFSIPVATYQYIICNSAFGLDHAFLFRTYTSSSTSQLLHGAVQNTDMSGNIFAYNKYTGVDSIYCNDGTALNQAITSDFTVYRSRLLGRISGSVKAFQDSSYLGENTSHVPTSSCRQFFGGVGVNTHYIDWCAVRKYTATEPTFTPQTEESAPTYTPVYTKKWKVSQI